ncbi:MAG: hypothetical protein LBR19_02725 [Bifidobacteriaceae bacterium]|jgi:predicted esterase|nr:hypothetical protein [Bifidobacteriaceae bacterium]
MDDQDTLDIYGGIAGTQACFEDMDALKGCLDLAAAAFEEVVGDLQAAQAAVSLAVNNCYSSGMLLDPSLCSVLQARDEVEALLYGSLVRTIGDSLDCLRSAVVQARANYEQAELQAAQQLAAGSSWWHDLYQTSVQVRAGLAPWAPGLAIIRELRWAPVDWLMADKKAKAQGGDNYSFADFVNANHDTVRSALGPLSGAAPTWGSPDTADVAGGLANLFKWVNGTDDTAVTVTKGTTTQVKPPANAAGVLRDLNDQTWDQAPARVVITQVMGADGQTRWLVEIPGTRMPDHFGGSNPADELTNLEAIIGDTNGVAHGVKQAMEQAGISRTEEVVMVGHSQGGIVTAGLLADPEFVKQYNVTAAMTAGSPIGLLPVASSVALVSLEHTADPITTMDGAENPRGRHQVTVKRDPSLSKDPAVQETLNGWLKGHSLVAYAETAKMVDSSNHLSLQPWKQATAPVLDPSAQAEQTVYVIERTEQGGNSSTSGDGSIDPLDPFGLLGLGGTGQGVAPSTSSGQALNPLGLLGGVTGLGLGAVPGLGPIALGLGGAQ